MESSNTATKDALVEGLIGLLRPSVIEVDERVNLVRASQTELRQHIENLSEDLKKIQEAEQLPIDLEPYVRKLTNARRRVMLINNILQNTEERLIKLQKNIAKETAKRQEKTGKLQASFAEEHTD